MEQSSLGWFWPVSNYPPRERRQGLIPGKWAEGVASEDISKRRDGARHRV